MGINIIRDFNKFFNELNNFRLWKHLERKKAKAFDINRINSIFNNLLLNIIYYWGLYESIIIIRSKFYSRFSTSYFFSTDRIIFNSGLETSRAEESESVRYQSMIWQNLIVKVANKIISRDCTKNESIMTIRNKFEHFKSNLWLINFSIWINAQEKINDTFVQRLIISRYDYFTRFFDAFLVVSRSLRESNKYQSTN